MLVRSLLACLIALLIGAEAAGGTLRFVEPEPAANGASPCVQADPCEIENAIENVAVDGDEVVLLSGTYAIGGTQLNVADDITIRSLNPAVRPLIQGTGSFVMLVGGEATIRDIAIEQIRPAFGADSAIWVLGEGTLVERVAIHAVNGGVACNMTTGTMRDSTCWSEGGAAAVGAHVASPQDTFESKLVNVTAVGDGAAGMNLFASAENVNLTVTAKNSIISPSILVAVQDGTTNASATATIENSNFQSSGTLGPNATVTAPGEGTNQETPPTLVHAPGFEGDFHQEPGSVTINAGLPDPLLGTLDFERQDRIMGDAVDIGADEFFEEDEPPPPDDTTAPQTTITDQPKAKVRLKKGKKKAPYSFSFTANEAATFRCSLDGGAPSTCTSPFGGEVKKGLHTFSVFAVDTAGNADPTPATAEWKVKKRKRRR